MKGNEKFNSKYDSSFKRVFSVKKIVFVAALVFIVCSVISGATIAYIYTSTEPVENVFLNARVACVVNETFESNMKTDVYISNTGDAKSYIRAAVVVTWMSEDGSTVTARKPVEGTDYVIEYNLTSDWKLGDDGYWYYIKPVEVGDYTKNLIDICRLADGAVAPDGFYLSVEIVASSIQAEPTSVVVSNWSSGVSAVNEGSLIIR